MLSFNRALVINYHVWFAFLFVQTVYPHYPQLYYNYKSGVRGGVNYMGMMCTESDSFEIQCFLNFEIQCFSNKCTYG